ncbi:uncharacterized protein [Periplaneta americana]|uniref:uncharacterized protein n=1 Tax=Periplaneta americana TaxID=6978 RepID=UPI0037E8F8DC
MVGLCEGGNEPPGSLKANIGIPATPIACRLLKIESHLVEVNIQDKEILRAAKMEDGAKITHIHRFKKRSINQDGTGNRTQGLSTLRAECSFQLSYAGTRSTVPAKLSSLYPQWPTTCILDIYRSLYSGPPKLLALSTGICGLYSIDDG